MSEQGSYGLESEMEMHWTLWREDIHGNQYRMPLAFDDEKTAWEAQDTYTAKGHHQTYSVKRTPINDPIDFIPAKE